MWQHRIGELLHRPVHELGDMPEDEFFRWVAYIREKQEQR